MTNAPMTNRRQTKRLAKGNHGKIEHHLLTIQITGEVHLHTYLMTDDKRNIEHAINRMFDEAEKRGCRPLPVVLNTKRGRPSSAPSATI
jgi:hypothetical protein